MLKWDENRHYIIITLCKSLTEKQCFKLFPEIFLYWNSMKRLRMGWDLTDKTVKEYRAKDATFMFTNVGLNRG